MVSRSLQPPPLALYCFYMIRTTRPGAMMAMGQAVVKEYNQARRPCMAQRGVLKSWGDGGLSLSVTTQERGAGSNRLPFLKAYP